MLKREPRGKKYRGIRLRRNYAWLNVFRIALFLLIVVLLLLGDAVKSRFNESRFNEKSRFIEQNLAKQNGISQTKVAIKCKISIEGIKVC